MNQLFQRILHQAERLGPQEWVLVLGGMLVVAFFCMRGFGSRSQY